MTAQNAMEKMTGETKVVMSMLCFCCWSVFYPRDLGGWLVVTGVVDRIIQRLHQTMTNGEWVNHFSWSSNTAKEQKEHGPHLQSLGPSNNVIQFWDNKRLIAAFQKPADFFFHNKVMYIIMTVYCGYVCVFRHLERSKKLEEVQQVQQQQTFC